MLGDLKAFWGLLIQYINLAWYEGGRREIPDSWIIRGAITSIRQSWKTPQSRAWITYHLVARALNDVKSRSSRSCLTAARGFCSLGLRDDTPEAARKGYENSHATKFSCWSEDEGTVDLCGQTVIKHRQTKANSGRNIWGNNAFLSPSHPLGPFISSSNRKGSRRAGLFSKKKKKTNKQE